MQRICIKHRAACVYPAEGLGALYSLRSFTPGVAGLPGLIYLTGAIVVTP
jgi:hypothetical protein